MCSPGVFDETVDLHPDINLVCTVPQSVGTTAGSCQLGTLTSSRTVTGNVAAYNASPDTTPGAQIVGFVMESCLAFDLSTALQEGFIYATNTTFACNSNDQVTGGNTNVGLVTFGGYIQSTALTLTNAQLQTWATPFIGPTVNVTSNNSTLSTVFLYASPIVANFNVTATNGSPGRVQWSSTGSPFDAVTMTAHGSGTAHSVQFFQTDPLPDGQLYFVAEGVDFPVVHGFWPTANLQGCTAGQILTGKLGGGAPFGIDCSQTSVGNIGFLQQATDISTPTSGTLVLSSTQYGPPFINVEVSLSGTLTIQFPNSLQSFWDISTEPVTFNAHTIVLECGTGTTTKTVSTNALERCYCDGANDFYCNP